MLQINEEITSLFTKYLTAYLTNRDLENTIKMFSKSCTGYGTGFDETAYHYVDFYNLFKRDFEQVPDKIEYTIINSAINVINENAAVVLCELDMHTKILDQFVKFNNLRLSLVFIKTDNEWFIEHMHISLPTEAHGEDEAYPLKELEEQNQLLQRLVDEKTRNLQDALDEISKIAVTDKLTGLYNRFKIDEFIKSEINRSNYSSITFSIILIDIDYFKSINDLYGHIAGDKVLAEFSDVLRAAKREHDLLGRWGGEEFLLICPDTTITDATSLAEQLRRSIESHPFTVAGKITASFGVAAYHKDNTYDELIHSADTALYHSKQNGRNAVSTSRYS